MGAWRCLGDARFVLMDCSNRKDALEQMTNGPAVDLLITDFRMPNMQGDELAQHARALDANLKVLYLTSYADGLLRSSS